MLDARTRQVYLDALRPPIGFSLDRAVGTTYSLDLQTLLTVPLGFAMLDWENASGKLTLDPVAVLHTLRSYSDRVTVFCETGRIALPTKHHPLFAHLEPMIVQVHAPSERGAFHAKTWLLRFTDAEGHVSYRFICLSRNLTADRSWDTILVLDGDLVERERAFAKNHPLGDFFKALPDLATSSLRGPRRDSVLLLAEELRRVRFAPPEPFEEIVFWPLGLTRGKVWPFDGRIDRLVVVSPFVSESTLKELASLGADVLVSRQESVEAVSAKTLKRIKELYVLDDEASEEDEDSEDEQLGGGQGADFNGLHAKLYIADHGWNASVWTGSANATASAFNGNVEFLVQLQGKKSCVGTDAFLGSEKANDGFRQFLRQYRPAEAKPQDPEQKANEERVEAARRRLGRSGLHLRVQRSGEPDKYDLILLAPELEAVPLPQVRARCRPVTIPESLTQDLQRGQVTFGDLTVHALTSFMAFEIAAGEGTTLARAQFVLNLPLEGGPDDRFDKILNAVLGDRERFLRYLLFLLMREEDAVAVGAQWLSQDGSGNGQGRGIPSQLPLFEELLRTLARAPRQLEAVGRLVEDLRRTPEGAGLLPEGFDEVWRPIWSAYAARKETQP